MNDSLRNLVFSLSKAEKKAIASHFGSAPTRHSHLYNLLVSKPQLTDDELIPKFRQYKIDKRNFNVLKKHLFNILLKILRGINDKDVQTKLSNDLQNIEILYNRGLLKDANKLLQSAIVQARSHDLHLIHLQLLDWERAISISSNFQSRTEAAIGQEEQLIFEKQQHLFRLKGINNILEQLKKEVGTQPKKAEGLINAKNIQLNEIFSETPESEKAKYYYHLNRQLFYFIDGDFEQSGKESDWLMKVDQDYLSEEEIINAYLHRTTALSFVYRFQDTLDTFAALDQTAEKLRLLRFPSTRNKIFYFRSTYMLSIYNKIKNESEGRELCNTILNQLENENLNQSQLNIVHYALALTLLLVGETKKSLRITNILLGQPVKKIRTDIYRWTLFVNIIAHYELDHSDLLSHLTRSYIAHFTQTRASKEQFVVETTFLSTLRKVPDVHSNASKEFKALYAKLQELSLSDTSEMETGIKTLLDSWLESKTEGISLLSTYQNKFY